MTKINLYEMIYGNVPYDATNIDDLLIQIHTRGPQFTKKKISRKVEALIRGLLEPRPANRLTHQSLFDQVLSDPSYPHSMLDDTPTARSQVPVVELSTSQSFIREVLYERAKYKFLVDLASRTAALNQ